MRFDADRAIVAAAQQPPEVPAQLSLFDKSRKHLAHDPPADTVQLARVDGGDQLLARRSLSWYGHESPPLPAVLSGRVAAQVDSGCRSVNACIGAAGFGCAVDGGRGA